ncbi:hypothetical protein MCG98_03355 [Ruminococcus sp. OA3]|uniref:uroporphyrinogen decarboxylase family protein n=1 Tax=Ruminococcus sp. OA3 TaxID=2914164 RepID=UPI001F062C19|nr:uroporphyrinogen decarboxylase family protein [Ruminococcus sp. OA3]MCH1981606.1 hypothetical protein [Ruminococcus sp. OA3]
MTNRKKNFIIESRMVPQPCALHEFPYPISQKENYKLCMEHKLPYWVPMKDIDNDMTFCPHDLDRPAFGTDGKDWFGVSWTYVDQVGGQMVTPDTFIMEKPSQWREKLRFPDLNQMDFTVGSQEARTKTDPHKITGYVMQDGLFERLLSLCTAEEALSWLLEEPEDAAEFFEAVADYKIALLEKLVREWAPFDLLINSDDWGTQISTFMAPSVFEKLLLPPMKRIADKVHELGLYWDCHSCGKTETLVPYMVELGFHFWEAQGMNDLKTVKQKYGNNLAIQFTLDPYVLQNPEITEEEVRGYVRQVIDTLGEGGGLILAFKALTPMVYTAVTTEIFEYSSKKYARERAGMEK